MLLQQLYIEHVRVYLSKCYFYLGKLLGVLNIVAG
jgi:hypothetical protein